MKELNYGSTLKKACLKADIDPKTGARYRNGYIPNKGARNYSTRQNPFEDELDEINELIESIPDLEAKQFLVTCNSLILENIKMDN